MKRTKSRFTSDEGLVLVNPLPYVDSFHFEGKIPFAIPDTVQTAEDMLGYLRGKLKPYKESRKPSIDNVACFFDDIVRDVTSFIETRGFSPKSIPFGEHVYELYNREKFPPKSHQRILQAVAGKMFGRSVMPKRVSGDMKLAYTGTYFECEVLDILGQVLLPVFDRLLQSGFRALAESTPENRNKVRVLLEQNFIDKFVSIIQKHTK